MHDRSHGGRVERESDAEDALARTMGDSLAEAALPGVFASGKTVIGSESGEIRGQKYIMFKFDDGSDLTFIGVFHVRANQGFVVEGQNIDGHVEHFDPGNQLMSGEGLGDNADVS